MFNLVKWGVELKMNWLNWSIPISSGFQFQFNSNSKSFNSIPIQFMLNWIELIINSNSIHELIRALVLLVELPQSCTEQAITTIMAKQVKSGFPAVREIQARQNTEKSEEFFLYSSEKNEIWWKVRKKGYWVITINLKKNVKIRQQIALQRYLVFLRLP